jgi:iron complex outermembrane receptor protein
MVVDNENNFELVGVSIIADNTSFAQSDATGKFTLELTPGRHTIKATYVGYNTFTDTITINAETTAVFKIRMVPLAKELKMVVVSASKFERNISEETVSINILKPSLIQNTNSITMDEAVNRVPGVNIIDGQANIRGGSGYSYGAGSRVLVLVDDLPQLTADAGDVKWEFLPVENLEQVEIIKGAASTL